MPHHWSDPLDGSLATEECEYADSYAPFTGWKAFHKASYIALNLFACPSQGWKPEIITNRQGIHYGFRYNSRRVLSYSGDPYKNAPYNGHPPRGVIRQSSRGRLPLFTDAARLRRDDYGMVVVTNTNNYYRRKWAHSEGGNILMHAGQGRWLNNRAPAWPAHWYGGNIWINWDLYVK